MADLGSTKVFGDLTVAGDIRIGGASGNMTAPDFIQSSAQSTNAAACTRKDYVDSAIAAGDALQVSKSGDTMTGNLTVPKVLVSGAQGTESNALTRKDYVDTELAKKLNLTGGTLTGNLTAPAVLVSSAQNTSANALTRKDYVDSAIAAGDALQVSKAGDTMTGTLTLSSSTFGTMGVSTGAVFAGMYGNTRVPHLVVADTSGSSYAPALAARYVHNTGWGGIYSLGVLNHNAQSAGSFCVHHINGAGGEALLWQFNGSSGDFTAPGSIFTESAQNNNGHALTRKDYVDSAIAAGDALQVAKTGDTMTGTLRTPAVHIPKDGADKAMFGAGGADIFIHNIVAGKYLQLKDDGTLQYSNQKVYHEGNKPTAQEVGALPITGGTLTGGITINNNNPTVLFQDTDNKSAFAHVNSNIFYILRSAGNNGTMWDGGPNGVHPMALSLDNGDATFSRNGSFNDVQIRSDIRLKSNLLPIVGALDKVYTLSGFTFDKFGCDKREAGIIAQDLKKVLPESVGSFKTTAGEEFLTVSNSGVNALLVEAIKELTDRVKYLESKIN